MQANFLRFGDFKSTGYPGALITLIGTDGAPYTYYLENVPCNNCDFLDDDLSNAAMLSLNLNPSGMNGLSLLW